MEKKTIINIHTDNKFVHGSRIFNIYFVNNINIVFEQHPRGQVNECFYSFSTKYYKRDIEIVLELCKSADIVVLWGLELLKMHLVTKISPNIIIIWRFLGVELYELKTNEFVTKTTAQYMNENKQRRVSILRKYLSFMKKTIQRRLVVPNNEITAIAKRINYFGGISRLEYDILKKKVVSDLPAFIQLPFLPRNDIKIIPEKKKRIIIGVNKSIWCNHIDVLHIIMKVKESSNYYFDLLFNYGKENLYTSKVKELVFSMENVKLIDTFMEIDEFNSFYEEGLALVFNTLRQSGGANIFNALSSGMKVYLNSEGIMYKWLVKEGFSIHTIEDFESDLKNKSIVYDEKEVEYNLNIYKKMCSKYSIHEFHQKIRNILFNQGLPISEENQLF